MKQRLFISRTLVALGLLLLMLGPVRAGVRSNLFSRNSRSMLGMGVGVANGGGVGEIYTVTPGARSLRAQLRSVASIGYGQSGNARRFTTNFGRNNVPRSIRGPSGSMVFTGIRGGGMRMLVKNLQGRRIGNSVLLHGPAHGLLARDAASANPFRFTGFDDFHFTREQLINDVALFGEPLARLIDDGFGSLNDFFQRIGAEILAQQPGVFDGSITDDVSDAAGRILSGFPSGGAQSIVTSPIDLVALFDPFLRLAGATDEQIAIIERFIAAHAEEILEILYAYEAAFEQLLGEVDRRNATDFDLADPLAPGVIDFASSDTAVLENAGLTYLYVYRHGGSYGPASVTVDVDASSSNATQPADFRFTAQTVSWADGETGPKAIAVRITDDRIEETASVSFLLTLGTPLGDATLGSTASTRVLIVDNDGVTSTSGVAVARNSMLVCEYAWPRAQRDLDTFTTFYNNNGYGYDALGSVGYSYSDSYLYADYMYWSGDDQNENGKETAVIDIDSALADGVISNSFAVGCAADWFAGAGGTGPATLSVYFYDKVTGRTSERAVLDPIYPGTYSTQYYDHAGTEVGSVGLQVDANGIVAFTLFPPGP